MKRFGLFLALGAGAAALVYIVMRTPNIIGEVRQAGEAAVRVRCATPSIAEDKSEKPEFSYGSGFFTDPEGVIGTNWHVVGVADSCGVFWQGREYIAEVQGKDVLADLASLKVKSSDGPFPYVQFKDVSPLQIGEIVYALGFPEGHDYAKPRTRSGIITDTAALFPRNPLFYYVQSDVQLAHGDSGGMLLDRKGRLVGISSRISDRNGNNYFIPAAVAQERLKILQHGHVKCSDLGLLGLSEGVGVSPLVLDMREIRLDAERREEFFQRGITFPTTVINGFVVDGTTLSDSAERIGLKDGDIITHADGVSIQNYVEFFNRIVVKPPDSVVILTILRGGEIFNLRAETERYCPG